ncbi:MAG: recombinase family protein [Candidatus Heteroscillospira sp.]
MRIAYGFHLAHNGSLEIDEHAAGVVHRIFDYYMAGASLGKVVDMLYREDIPSPTGKPKWTRAAVDHLLSNSKYIVIVGLDTFMDVQFEKEARCNIDYDKASRPRKSSRYVSPAMLQL